MNIALIGSVSSSWYALDALIRGNAEVTGVLGVDESRSARISDYRPLRELAGQAGIPFLPFVKVAEPAVQRFLWAHAPDLLWVIGLSQLVPDSLIKVARVSGVGFHPTLLPEGRGRAPVAWTILRQARAAVSVFHLTAEPDAGDIIAQREVPVLPNDYSEDLIHRTNLVLADVVRELAPQIRAGRLPRTPQDSSKATYYPKRTPADGRIDWAAPTDEIYRLIRAAGRPYPGAFTHTGLYKLTIWRAMPARADDVTQRTAPGSVLAIQAARGTLVATTDGGIWMTEVEVAGGAPAAGLLEVGAKLS